MIIAGKNKKDIKGIFVYRLDRLSRQTSDYLALRKRFYEMGIALISASEPTGNSPTEKLLETVLASFAQHDNDVRSERTKNGMRAKFLSGQITNHSPLGYITQSGQALEDPEKFDTIKKAWNLMATGTKSLKEMAKLLSDWGIKIRPQTAQRMFRNKFYMGLLTSDKYPEIVKGQHTPMITEEQFYKVQAILDGRNRSNPLMQKRSRDNVQFPLRRILRCSKCGTPFTGAWSRGRHSRYAYYFCRNRCVTSSIPLDDINNGIRDFLKAMSPSEAGLRIYVAYLHRSYHQKMLQLNKTKNEADVEISKLHAQRQLLVEKNLAGIYSDEVFKEQNALIENRVAAAQASKDEAMVDQYNIDAIEEFVKDKLADLSKTFDSYIKNSTEKGLSELRCLLGSIFTSGIVWGYPGCSNRKISPIYQAIRDAANTQDTIGRPNGIRTHD